MDVRHGEEEGGQEDEVGEHGAEEGEGGEQPEGEGAAEAGEAEDAEAEEEDDGGVYHALPGLAEGVGDGAGHVPGGGLEFLAVFGEVVDGVASTEMPKATLKTRMVDALMGMPA